MSLMKQNNIKFIKWPIRLHAVEICSNLEEKYDTEKEFAMSNKQASLSI